MLHPSEDIEDRSLIWDYMQNFWMHTDPLILLPEVARVSAPDAMLCLVQHMPVVATNQQN